MKIDELAERINKQSKLYDDMKKEVLDVLSKLNNLSAYKADLHEEHPYLRIEIEGLGLNLRIKPVTISNTKLKTGDTESAIIELINYEMTQILRKN